MRGWICKSCRTFVYGDEMPPTKENNVEDIILSEEEVEMMREEVLGLCLECREEVDEIDWDARNYDCPHCGESMVFGADSLVELGLVKG